MEREIVVTIVKATCPRCGDVELTPADIQLRICSVADASTYHFTCRRCDKVVAKPAADERIVMLLTSVGVPTVEWHLPAELDEVHDGPPISIDDLIDLRLLLDRPDWADQLAASAT
jgi:phage FluMu protein Com